VPQNNTVYYYRIRSTSNTGDVFYSNKVPVVFGNTEPWLVYPNPITAQSGFLQFQLPKGTKLSMHMYDMQGKLVMQQGFTATGNIDKVQIATSIVTGIYNLKVFDGDRTEMSRVLKN
jgi:hypothetical protein